MTRRNLLAACALSAAACGGAASPAQKATIARAAHAELSLAADDRMVLIPGGRSIAGSTPEERAAAYDEAALTGGDAAVHKGRFDREAERHTISLPGFRIDLLPVTQAQYAEFVAAERVAPPAMDDAAWRAQGFPLDFASQVARYVWHDGQPPAGREDHPVVLVSWEDAGRYCAWRGVLRGQPRRLPTADEIEKAARGEAGLVYPWGNAFEHARLNSAVRGPGDTVPAGSRDGGASPYGVLDLAGNVFQWTATPGEGDARVVKGSGWTEGGGVGRGASFSTFPRAARHAIIGFRCAADASEP